MGRKRKLGEPGCVVCGYVPYSLARAIRDIASRKGITVSDAVREALEMYAAEETVRLGLSAIFEPLESRALEGQVEMDKVDLVEAEEFEESLSRLEGYVSDLERLAEGARALLENPRLLRVPKNQNFARVFVAKVRNAVDWFYKLKREYNKLRQRRVVRRGWDLRLYEVWSRLHDLRRMRTELERELRLLVE